ncbi:hypothetical protein QVD17_32126 [Tagetes erecta]|uniref:Uncharacterized protein n=1 Tax=Tagetes erecta TaxID=13708 RepID=A0AAD8K926_TARER|nr:hypothetical protein QVD17_32126 [Tagetes erecta]
MADDLKLHVKQLFSLSTRRSESVAETDDLIRRIAESYDGLMICITNMMVGYENKEVEDLLTKLKRKTYHRSYIFWKEWEMHYYKIGFLPQQIRMQNGDKRSFATDFSPKPPSEIPPKQLGNCHGYATAP